MPAFHVEKFMAIAAPREEVFAVVRDFRRWKSWSPWVIAEPDCPLSYAEDGSSYSWDGKIVGAGELAVIRKEAPASLDLALSFFKPWKSHSTTRLELKSDGDGTKVTWTMDGSLPFFMFWMRKQMTAFVGMDYERGLAMLKDLIETGSVPSKLEFPGVEEFAGCRFLGVRSECDVAGIGPSMQASFGKLHEWFAQSGAAPSGPPFSVYHKWDAVKGRAQYTAAIPLADPPAAVPAGMLVGEMPACAAYTIRHTGPYRYLGNAWAAAVMHGRAKQFAQKRGIHPFEVYLNDSTEIPEEELVTVVHFPVK